MTELRVRVGDGPAHPIASRPHVGLTTLEPWECRAAAHRPGVARGVLRSGISTVVRPGDELRYGVLPEFRGDLDVADRFAATGVALDLVFADGGRLSDVGAVDQYGVAVDPAAQYAAKVLLVDQWSLVRVDLSGVVGREVVAVEALLAVPETAGPADGDLVAWIDAVDIRPRVPLGDRPSDAVRTTRGTHSAMLYSRGNTLPAVGMPHGAMMATPVTRAGERHWLYAWHAHNDAANRTRLEGFATTLVPSPWIGERAAFQVMPGTGVPTGDRAARSLAFSHDDEVDRAHLYAVTFDGGIRAELAPTRHGLALRATFPDGAGHLVFDQVDGHGAVRLEARADRLVVTGWTEAVLERVPIVPRMFVWGEVDTPPTATGRLDQPDRPGVTGFAAFDADSVTLRLGTSFLSLEQARANLEAELPRGTTFDEVRDAAQAAWDEVLSVVSVEGATDDQRVTLASNLYRLFLFPNVAGEEAGLPGERHASPFLPRVAADDDAGSGLAVVEGGLTVNNGYWDTYRTAWPMLALLDPERTGRLLDGVVQHYRESGWTTRWSAPGHVDVMVGTSSDAVLADAAVRGVPGFDLEEAYDSGLRNASVPPPEPAVGRKGLARSIFAGYTATSVPEGLSWSLEAAINDFALARFSELLARSGPEARRAEFADNARWLRSRARGYRHLFDARVGHFQGRGDDGAFRLDPDVFDPGIWGSDYTETNGWGMTFTVPHDGNGLAWLFGGREGLAARLDAFFATPEPGGDAVRGTYSYLIHEISEAKDIRLGMLALSNQPAHHIPAMYLFAGRPDRTQAIVRECLDRLFLGSDLGQGYPGDEDNGEMSTWWLANALGLYPLVVGEPGYVVTSPLFPRATVRLPGGRTLEIVAHGAGRDAVYVQSLRVDGEPWSSTWIPHAVLAAGARLEFELGPEPSAWGSRAEDAPPSLTPLGEEPRPLVDVAVDAGRSSHPLAFDDDSTHAVVLAPGEAIEYRLAAPAELALYTVTTTAGPASWTLDAVDHGRVQRLDERVATPFRWERQTRPFAPAHATAAGTLRFTNASVAPLAVHQLEFLA